MRGSLALVAVLLASAGFAWAAGVGCQKTPEPEKAKPQESAALPTSPPVVSVAPPTPTKLIPLGSPASASAATNLPGDMQWDVPKAWTTAPSTSSMRKATYKIAKAEPDTDDAEMSVTQVGGGVDANITRWAGQFGGATPTRTHRKVNGLEVTIVELHGPYAGGMPGAAPAAPKEKQALLGAVVETEPTFFFKLTGGEKTIEKAKPDFEKLVGSFRPK